MSTPPPPPGYNPPPPPGGTPPPYGGPQFGAPPPPAYGGPQYGAPQYGAPPPGYQAYGQGADYGQRAYAGFGGRLGAYILDALIGALFGIPAIIALFAAPKHYTDCTVDGEPGICKVPTGAGWALIIGLGVLGGIVFLVLWAKKVGSTGQSWGMKATNIRVIDKDTSQPIGTGRAVGRYFARILSGAICYLGFLWMLWDKDKQTWHDKIVGSVVVKA